MNFPANIIKKKYIFASLLSVCTLFTNVANAELPTCVLLKFNDDTRYKEIESAASLSDLVLEKLLNTGKVNLKEKFSVDDGLEELLYNERAQELYKIKQGFKTKNFNTIFEHGGFDELNGQTIATSSLGQIVSPAIIKKIGVAHNADFLIHGTIINLGTGDWWDEDAAKIAKIVDTTSGLLGMTPIAKSLQYLQGISVEKTGIGVQCDLRIISAKTGEVIWYKRVTEISTQKQFGIALITVGSNKMTSSLYDKAMDKASSAIVNALLEDDKVNSILMR